MSFEQHISTVRYVMKYYGISTKDEFDIFAARNFNIILDVIEGNMLQEKYKVFRKFKCSHCKRSVLREHRGRKKGFRCHFCKIERLAKYNRSHQIHIDVIL